MVRHHVACALSAATALLAVTGRAAAAEPDLLRPANLKTMGCAKPDTRYTFVRSSRPGNVFYPGEAVDLTVRVTRGGEPLKSISLAVLEIAMRRNRYLEGWSTMSPPAAVEVVGRVGKRDVSVTVEDRQGATAEIVIGNLPVPAKYGTYAVTIAPNGRDPQFLCTLLRAHRPKQGFDVDAPVFGEGQFLTHDDRAPEKVRQRALTLGRLGIKGVRIELGWSESPSGEFQWTRYDALMNALAEAKVKALVTMGGHPSWTMPFGRPTPACIPTKPDHSCMPRYYDRFERWIRAFCRRYWKDGRGALWAIEHWNEPWEGISISGWESDSNHYRELMRRIARGARSVDRRIKTAAACSIMNTEDKFLIGEDREELIKLVDLLTDHYVPPRTSYGPMVAKHWGKESTDTETWIAATEVLLPQIVCQFLACGQDRMTPWHPEMIYFAVPGAPMKYQMPNPVALASNVFNVFVTGRKFQRLMFLDHLPWAFQFGAGRDAVVVLFGKLYAPHGGDVRDVLWWQLQLADGGTIAIDNADGALELYDIAGNRELQGRKTVTLPMSYLAHYIRCPRGGAELIEKRLRAARIEGVRPVEIVARDFAAPVDAPDATARVTLHNLLNRPVQGTLKVTPPKGVRLRTSTAKVKLSAGQTLDLRFNVKQAKPDPTNAYLFSYEFVSDAGRAQWKEDLHALVARRQTKKVDGRLDDWGADLGVLLDAKGQKVDPTERAWMPFLKAREARPDGSFAEVKLAWDDRFLYLAARVNDPTDYAGHQRLQRGEWDEDQYFRSRADDRICERLKPFEKLVTADMRRREVAEKLKADPKWAAYQKLLAGDAEAKAAVETGAARAYIEGRRRNPKAAYADATHVYKKVPWSEFPWSGDTFQFSLDLIDGYYPNMKPDTDRVPYGFHAMPDADYEYAAYACTDGGTELWRVLAPGVPRGHHYPRQPRAKYDQGPVAGGKLAVRRDGRMTVYEMALPWAEMKLDSVPWKSLGTKPWRPEPGRTFGFLFRVNNNKGPALVFGAEKSATKTNGLSLHPYWQANPSCTVRWALASGRPAERASAPPAERPSPKPTGGWVDISAGVLGKLSAASIKPAWPGKTTGVAVDRTTGHVYMIVCGEGVWRSSDKGATFERVDGKAVGGRCETGCSLQLDPAGKRLACFMLDGRSARTDDGGRTWTPVRNVQRGYDWAAVDWTGRDVKDIFALVHESGGIGAVSSDAGKTWKQIGKRYLAVGIFPRRVLLCGREKQEGVFRSTDDGRNWTKVSDATPVGVMAVFKDVGYWLTNRGLLVTSDRGKTWKRVGKLSGAAWGPYFGRDESHFVVVDREGFQETSDAGRTWRLIAPLPPSLKKEFNPRGWFLNVAWDPLGKVCYASRMGRGTYKYEYGDGDARKDKPGPKARDSLAGKLRFELEADAALTSAGVFDHAGRLVRQLWALKPMAAGKHTGTWDGRDEFGKPVPAGEYTFRVVLNGSTYRNVGILGNTGTPPNEMGHIQHGVISVTTDARGRIYTANGWEEAGHDFKVMDSGGSTLFHARYQIRNGNPNGAPHAIAVDDTHIYCATHGWASKQWKSKQQIQRFRITDGKHETFAGIEDNAGHIQLYEWPEKQVPEGAPDKDAELMRLPVRALAVRGDDLFATDALGGKVHRFHKTTGKTLGEFPIKLPAALAVDAEGRLWVGHEHGRVSVYDVAGKRLAEPIADLGEVKSLAFGPNGLLYAADGEAGQVRIYRVSDTGAKQVRTFGRPAGPGDHEPDRFYGLRGAAVDGGGNLVTIQTLPTGGARIARFGPDGKCLWEHMALMFCDVGNVAPWRPGEFITHRFHRLVLTDRNAGRWEYRGTVLDGDAKLINWQHGVLRLLRLGGAELFFQCYGDGLQVYRRQNGLYRLAAMVGGVNPLPDGRYNDRLPGEKRQKLGQWTWTDANGNGRCDKEEVVWFKEPGKGRYAVFGMNIDAKGSVLYCDHHTRGIWELPLAGANSRGNPVYDWAKARQLTQRDTSPVKLFPLMAIRADDGTIYAFGRSEVWKRPGGKTAGYAWMGGWALRRYDKHGKTLWSAKLPQVCVGMDAIPGGRGVMLGYFEKAHIYHYDPDGLLIGMMQPGDAAGKVTGWMDNTSAVAVSRDPRDGMLDVFGEDSWLNRNVWYRVDDRNVNQVTGTIEIK